MSLERERNAQLALRIQELEADLQEKEQVSLTGTARRPCSPVASGLTNTCDGVFQELEDLRKQAETIPQLMAKCESITAKLQVNDTQTRHCFNGRRSRIGSLVH